MTTPTPTGTLWDRIAAALEGTDSTCRLDLDNPPPLEHEGGERLEWPDLRLAPPMSEVYARLGITPPEETTRP